MRMRNKLELYTLITFPSVDDVPVALAALLADPYVEDAAEPLAMDFSTAPSTDLHDQAEPSQPNANQYGWDDMNLAAAWDITGGGYALVAQVDMGLDVSHPALRQFLGSSYVGGNFVQIASKDVGLTGLPVQPGFNPADVDEAKPEWITAGTCTPVDASLPPARLGHGTHAAGLLGANGAGAQVVHGTCRNCGIAMYKSALLVCRSDLSPSQVVPNLNVVGAERAKAEAIDTGAQAVSMSFGGPNPSASYNCTGNRSRANCLTIAYAVSRDAALIGASGNERLELDFPASDKRVISAGGFQPNLGIWNDAPNCPPSPNS
jgi:serine protease